MTLLRHLASDLVEKRLWPIAAALLAAIVAVPLVLGGGAATPASDSATPAPGASSAAVGQTAQVRLDTSAPASLRPRSSKARNPFTSRSMPKDPAANATSTTASTLGATVTQGAKSVTGSTPTQSVANSTPTTIVSQPKTTAPSKKTTAVTHKKASAREIAYRVAWRFGEEGAQLGNHNAARLTALPSPAQPAVHFLGLLKRKSGPIAVFLLEPGVQVHGDGRCEPDPANCHTLKLRPHQTELIEAATGTGGLVQYRLDVVHIDGKKVTPATARRLRLRESKAGRRALRSAIDAGVKGVGEYVFERAKGLLAPYVPKLND